MNALGKFFDNFYPNLYKRSKLLCFSVAFLKSLVIVILAQYWLFDKIDIFLLPLATFFGWFITVTAKKRLKERHAFNEKLTEYAKAQTSKRKPIIKLLTFLGLTILAGMAIDLIHHHLVSIDYDTSMAGYHLIYLFGYALSIPLLVAITNWEHVGVVYERYATRELIQGLPWFYHFGVGASVAYATSNDVSGVIMALLFSFGTAYHIYYSIPPVVKNIQSNTANTFN